MTDYPFAPHLGHMPLPGDVDPADVDREPAQQGALPASGASKAVERVNAQRNKQRRLKPLRAMNKQTRRARFGK
jgi:hypothetical protein